MNFNLTEQQQQIVDQVREFTAQRLAPGVLERDEQQVFPVEAFKEFGAMGMFGLCYPKEFGGTDIGYLPYILAVEEVSKVDPPSFFHRLLLLLSSGVAGKTAPFVSF